MGRSVLFILSLMIFQALGEMCYYTSSDRFESCDWGCCSTTEWPCCYAPLNPTINLPDLDFYDTNSYTHTRTPFIAGITVGSVVLVIFIVAAVVCMKRRTNVITTIQSGTPASPQVFSTCTSTNAYMGYSNPGYSNGPRVY